MNQTLYAQRVQGKGTMELGGTQSISSCECKKVVSDNLEETEISIWKFENKGKNIQ